MDPKNRSAGAGRALDLFLAELGPKLKTLKESSWDALFPLNRFMELEELSIHGSLSEGLVTGVFSSPIDEPHMKNLKRIFFNLEGQSTSTMVAKFVQGRC